MMAIRLAAAVLMVLLPQFALNAAAQFVDCDTDCNGRCRLGNVFGNDVIEPGCKLSCEASKAASCPTGIPIPAPLPPVPGAAMCSALFFDQFNAAVIAMCSNWDGRLDDQHLINGAIQSLMANGVLNAADFGDIQIRWCDGLEGEGVAPRHNRIYLHPQMKVNGEVALAALLAHEVRHIQQYRRMGDADFGCTYTRQYLECGRCQDRGHPLEREAYEFEDVVRARLSAAAQPGPFSPPPPPPPPISNGFAPGTTMAACACYGPGPAFAPEPRCQSGSVRAVWCQGLCPTGTAPYGYVCQ